MPATILLAPAPRRVADIFDAGDLARLGALGTLIVQEDRPVEDARFKEIAPDLTMVIGQVDLLADRLTQAPRLRAIFNVEGNFLPNIDYQLAMRSGIRVLNISPVFAEPVAELALGMAIDLARGISRSDRMFRAGRERYGLDANRDAYSLFGQDIGFVGLGDVGRAIVPLLGGFRCRIRAFDPWLPADYIASFGCEAVSLDAVLQASQIVFVVAGVTAQNQGFLDASSFRRMKPGAALILVSRAGVVDFEAMLDAAERGHIRVATDVFPVEPVAAGHRARRLENLLLSPHQAGALEAALKQIGKRVVADAELIAQGLPPAMCKVAQPETVGLLRSMPVSRS